MLRKVLVYGFRVVSTIALPVSFAILLLYMILIEDIPNHEFESVFDLFLIVAGCVCVSYAIYPIAPKYAIPHGFNIVERAVQAQLQILGYHWVNRQPYFKETSSRYTVWANDSKAIRLFWNGKQKWFVLEAACTLPLNDDTVWNDLITVPYNPKVHGNAYISLMTDGIVSSLSGIVS